MRRTTQVSSAYWRGGRGASAALLLAFLLIGTWWWWTSRPTIRRAPGLNVLLITIDTLRADAVGAYGRAGSPTPWIDRLAQAGVRFPDAHAHNVVTLPSHANLLTGQLPPAHGVRDNAGFRLPQDTATLATILQASGYRTAAFVSAFPLDSRFGLARGFDVYDDRFADAGPRPAFLIQERRGPETVRLARQWLDAAGDGPWFCWVHLYEPHFPYEPPEPFASRWPGDPYAGEVAAADAALRPLLEPILAAGQEGRTLVVVTSDHGESLGEHGEATHGIFAYEAALRVPLVVFQPRLFGARVVVDAPAGHVDVLPTMLDALGHPIPEGLAGRSLLPAIAGVKDAPDRAVYFEALSGSLNRGWAPLFGLLAGGFKYIDLPVPELYDLRADPREQRNLAASDRGRLEVMHARLEALRGPETVAPRRPESADARERLRSLGYIVGGATPRAVYTEDDDPKRLIALDTMLQGIVERYLAGDLKTALERSRDLVRRRPGMAVSWMHLAHLEREAGNLGAAVDALQRAVALMPEDAETLALLGAYLTEAGRAREAVDLLEHAAQTPDADLDVVTTRALALARLGEVEAAVSALSRAREREPRAAALLVHLGTVHLIADDRAAARAAFEEGLRLNPDVARAHSSLAVLALEDGRTDAAAEHWRSAVVLDPREIEKILALGLALDRANRTAEARACFEFFAQHADRARYARELERVRMWLAGAR